MPKLFLDIGNTRIKAAIVEHGVYSYLGVIPLQEFISPEVLNVYMGAIIPDTVYISSVASLHTLEPVKLQLFNMYQLLPVMLTSQKVCCGLITGYRNPHQLGDDRWMALQGAHSMSNLPSIVIDAGTAMTIDAIVDGQHLGGFIVPGLTSLRRSLGQDTENLTSVENFDNSTPCLEASILFADNTTSGILDGTLFMTSSFINRVIYDFNQQVGSQCNIYLTGGNASKLIPLLDSSAEYVPDLVLLGMKIIVESAKK